MMGQYKLILSDSGQRIPSHRAYPLYAWLLEQLPEEYRDLFHESTENPLSQYLRFDRESGRTIWTVNLLTEDLCRLLGPVLTNTAQIPLHTGTLQAEFLEKSEIPSATQLILDARDTQLPGGRMKLDFLSPTSFRQDGRYVLFPQEKLILNSLIRRWNQVCPEYPLDDPDAVEALERGIRITDYQLRSAGYWLKDSRISGFQGTVTLSARLAPPLMELWQILVNFAPYAGVGIKTSLGMGGIGCRLE